MCCKIKKRANLVDLCSISLPNWVTLISFELKLVSRDPALTSSDYQFISSISCMTMLTSAWKNHKTDGVKSHAHAFSQSLGTFQLERLFAFQSC